MNVGEALVARRAELGLSRAAAAKKAGIDVGTLRSAELNERWPQDVNRAKIEQALGWAPGSLEAIRDGGEPTTAVDDFADRVARDLKPGDMARFSERISKAISPVAIQSEGLRAAVDALLPKIDVSSFIPKGALEAVTDAALPASVVQNIMRAAENSASELLPDLIDVLSVEQRARLTYEILDILEEQGVDVEKLLDEEVNDVPDLGVTSDGQVWERDRRGNWAAVRTIKMESRGVIWVGRRSAFMPADNVTSRFGDITILDKKVLRDLLREAGSREIKPESIAAAALQSTSSVRDDLAARRDSNTPPRSIRNVVDDDDPTAGIDWRDYAAHPKTDPLEEDNPTP